MIHHSRPRCDDERDRCLCGEELDENGGCPECDVTYDTTDPARDDPQEEDLT